jgi:hypothetical protein
MQRKTRQDKAAKGKTTQDKTTQDNRRQNRFDSTANKKEKIHNHHRFVSCLVFVFLFCFLFCFVLFRLQVSGVNKEEAGTTKARHP